MTAVVVGQKWRTDTGGTPLIVVAIEGGMAIVKRSDSTKKQLATPAGGQLAAVSEFATWTLLEEAPA